MHKRKIPLENETKRLHTGKFLIIFKDVLFLHQTVDRYKLALRLYLCSVIHMRILTLTLTHVFCTLDLFKKLKSWSMHQGRWWWWEFSPMTDACLYHVAVAQLLIRLTQRNYCPVTLSCSLNCVPCEIFEKLTDLLTLCAYGMGSQSREEAGMLFWKTQFSPLMGF